MANQIVIHGRLTRDPEIKTFSGKNGDTSVCNISVASNRPYGDDTDFFNCFQFGKGAEALEKHFNKGKEIVIFGEMQMDSYKDKEGNNKYSWKCKISHWEFCGSKSDSSNSSKQNDEPTVDSFEEITEDVPF